MKKARLNRLRVSGIILTIIVGLNALAAGFGFITDPTGKGLGMSTAYLKSGAPFRDFSIPGIVLFSVNGLGSLMVAGLTIFKNRYYPEALILFGIILCGWIGIQLMMVVVFHLLHVIIFTTGIALADIGLTIKKSNTAFKEQRLKISFRQFVLDREN